MSESIAQQKAQLRRDVRERLTKLTAGQVHQQSAAACAKAEHLEAFVHASVVMLYMPLPGELDLTPLALRCFQMGKTVAVPQVDWSGNDMRPVEASSFDDEHMHIDERGLRSPREGRPLPMDLLDLIIVPGLAFDPQGWRLGRGGGYYDRFLARLKPRVTKVGLCFDQQIVELIPNEPHDIRMNVIITDRRLNRVGRTRTQR